MFGNAGTAFNNVGTYTKSGASVTSVNTTFTNSGLIDIQSGILQINTPFENTGTIQIASTAILVGNTSDFRNEGVLTGSGHVDAPQAAGFVNQGVIAPGSGIGTMTFGGDLHLGTDSVLEIQLTNAASFDQIAIDGDISIGGLLALENLGYSPTVGDSFLIATFDAQTTPGSFSDITWSGFGAGVTFFATYNADHIILNVAAVPEPAEYLMMLAGLGVIGAVARRRQRR